jgi:hypothetical protein
VLFGAGLAALPAPGAKTVFWFEISEIGFEKDVFGFGF